ncbi:hypothetical protein CR194_17205 [Salipaludibacillus keqinensis]|uniref:SIMPL domain-containing protein n=1 Tax=Salipaludibacillus keqinensis TaxID=2045207 RepID=A0A323T8Z2_9BACI|nr:SIMPL domain-containing protein [Salipaludibacillus keqinensis]PYZ91939.1 hypothetical protein CR194_17205 [Salipaludibacillus keqinensis]
MYDSYREQGNGTRMMTVIGEGNLSVEPDTASVELDVVTENESLSLAQQENAVIMTQVIQALIQLGIPREHLQTTTYNIRPTYDYVDGQQVFRNYQVVNGLTVTIKNLNQVGQAIDVAVENGVNRVSNIELTVENPNVLYQRSLNKALQDAQLKAQTIARTFNVNVDLIPVKVIELNIDRDRPFTAFASVQGATTTPIEPGQLVIVAKVEAQFQY